MRLITFNACFQVICFVATTCLISKCIHEYHLDKDKSQLEYRKFHDGKGSIYPSFSICFPWYTLFNSTKMYQITKNEPKLSRHVDHWYCWYFWWGCESEWYQLLGDLLQIVDYENVTIDFMKHLLSIEIHLKHHGRVIWSNNNGTMKLSGAFESVRRNASIIQRNFTKEKVDLIRDPNIYLSYKSYHYKCYSVDVPFVRGIQITKLRLKFKGSIFKHGIRPSRNEFRVNFHYPNQQSKALSAQRTWVSIYNFSTFYEKHIYLGYVNILQRRNKRAKPCHDKDYDSYVIEKATRLVGCKFHASTAIKTIPFCNTSSQIRAFNYELTNQIPPCRRLISAYEWYTETDKSDENKNINTSLVDLTIHYPNDFYKELIYTQEYSFESLIGNIGGYIGKN